MWKIAVEMEAPVEELSRKTQPAAPVSKFSLKIVCSDSPTAVAERLTEPPKQIGVVFTAAVTVGFVRFAVLPVTVLFVVTASVGKTAVAVKAYTPSAERSIPVKVSVSSAPGANALVLVRLSEPVAAPVHASVTVAAPIVYA